MDANPSETHFNIRKITKSRKIKRSPAKYYGVANMRTVTHISPMIVFDKMQQGYAYEYDAPMGRHFASDFKPELTPQEILKHGVFEGHYMTDCQNEFPTAWFQEAKLSPAAPNIQQNCFKVKSRMSLPQWRERGWIIGPDPRGWFQWYCRYYMGRRLPEIDAIQIKRWRAFRRHLVQVERNCAPLDLDCRPRQRQALLQWAYNPFF